MFEQFIKMPHVSKRLKRSKFKYLLDQYAAYVISRQYAKGTIRKLRNSIEHFLNWVESEKPEFPIKINKELTDRFLEKHIPICKCPLPAPRYYSDLRAALHILLHIQPEVENEKSISEIDTLINEFDNYLIHVCGIAENTRLYHRRHLRMFLSSFFNSGHVDLDRLNPKNVRNFLYENINHYKRRSFAIFVYSLRSFFKFLQFKGIGNSLLISALPRIIEWKSAALPEYLNKNELKKYLSVFDRNTALGKRDYAMVICIIEIGLRSHEVAYLTLDDINWREQTIHLPRGKTRQPYVLPMTLTMRDALAEYLQHGRPKSNSRQVFVYHRAPMFGNGIIPKIVNETVRRAFIYSGLTPTIPGAHLLRRTFATNLLHHGATIKEIADLLRHRSINITAIYTKVDFSNLTQVSLPWPEDLL